MFDSMRLVWFCALVLILTAAVAYGSKPARPIFTFCCKADNDLYRILSKTGRTYPRFATPAQAVQNAPVGSAVLILETGYPEAPTPMDAGLFQMAQRKKLRLYVEYPSMIPGMEIGPIQSTVWERCVVASDAFGGKLPKHRILALHGCHYIPVKATSPLLVAARVAGFDTAVFGLPPDADPILFRDPGTGVLVAVSCLSGFVTGRYAPQDAWEAVWEYIFRQLNPSEPAIKLKWEPIVQPSFTANEVLPSDWERQALTRAAHWYLNSRLLLHPARMEEVHKLLAAGDEGIGPPGSDAPIGDGSLGILEGYASAIKHDGSQMQRLPLRADCIAESAMALSLALEHGRPEAAKTTAFKLLDYLYSTSGMQGGDRGNPKHPSFGLIAWGAVSPAWEVANYSDDDARVILATALAAACLGTDKWDKSVMRALLANLRTTGSLGFRGDRIDQPRLEAQGWKAYHDAPTVNYSPHFESYLWAANIWAYARTGYKPFLENTRTAIRMTMDVYPDGWRWQDNIERARMLLCLAWLLRVEDTSEHRGWLMRVADDLLANQVGCGAIREVFIGGKGSHYKIPGSNEAYGTTETPLIQENGDPASDQLYTTGFALLGLHEAAAALEGNAEEQRRLRQAEDKLMRFLCRVQIRSKAMPYLDGAWFRAFDDKRWEYWASSADMGWGAWSVETGWGTAWTTAVLGLRLKRTSFWDITSGSRLDRQFHEVRQEMQADDGGPWKRG